MKRFLLAFAVLLLASVHAQTAAKPRLGVQLTSDRTSYSLRDDIKLEVARENIGDSDVVLYRRWEWGASSKIRVFDSSGKEVKDVFKRLTTHVLETR